MVWDRKRTLDELTLSDFQGVPRVSSWIPRHADVAKIVNYMRIITRPRVSCMACGNGFEAALLAKEGLDIWGIDLNLSDKDRYASVPSLTLMRGDLKEDGPWYRTRNIIFNSWMLGGEDWSSYFYNSRPGPKMIVYVAGTGKCGDGYTGVRAGMANNPNAVNSYRTPYGFVEVDRWNTFGAMDFKNTDSTRLCLPSCEVIVQVSRIQFAEKEREFNEIKSGKLQILPYRWEGEMP